MFDLPAPSPLNGHRLRAELRDAGIHIDSDDEPRLVDGRLHFRLPDEERDTVTQVVDSHTGDPTPNPTVEDRLAGLERRVDKAAAADVSGDAAKVRDGLKPGR